MTPPRDSINQAIKLIDLYPAARTMLCQSWKQIASLPGGPWVGRCSRPGMRPETGDMRADPSGETWSGTIAMNLHAAFDNFALADVDGNAPLNGTPAKIAEDNTRHWLYATRDCINALMATLPQIEKLTINGVSTEPLTRFRLALPHPPYLPLKVIRHIKNAEGTFGFGDNGGRKEPGTADITHVSEAAPMDRWESTLTAEQPIIDEARVCLNRLLIGLNAAQPFPSGMPQAELSPNPQKYYIDLDQAAALINHSKRTLERQITVGKMPPPAIQGSGGKKSEWLWSELKPWLEKEYSRILPDIPPHYR